MDTSANLIYLGKGGYLKYFMKPSGGTVRQNELETGRVVS
jgi:hypothetical protein